MAEENKLSPDELENIKRALKSSYKERFEKATRLYKINKTMEKANIKHRSFKAKQHQVDIFDEAILNFWKALQEFNVNYILIGGYALNLHGFHRFTGDLDIWIEDTPENRLKLRAVFNALEMGDYPQFETMQFVPGWSEFYLNNGFQLDILTEMKGLEEYSFDECLQMASIADIDGVNVPFLHINQLIQNKKSVNRLKDQLDVTALEAIKKLREDI